MNIIEFFLSQEVTLSSKLLEILYICIGMIACYSAYRNAFDKSNPHRYGTAFFWGMLGILLMMLFARPIGAFIDSYYGMMMSEVQKVMMMFAS